MWSSRPTYAESEGSSCSNEGRESPSQMRCVGRDMIEAVDNPVHRRLDRTERGRGA